MLTITSNPFPELHDVTHLGSVLHPTDVFGRVCWVSRDVIVLCLGECATQGQC